MAHGMNLFYSQAGQDRWVSEYFSFKRKGFFVDIGAYDGIELSNTYFLEKDLGWSGILVEADPLSFISLSQNRTSVAINKAVSGESGRCYFEQNGLYGKIGSTGIPVDVVTIQDVLIEHKAPRVIDYLSLDIEGEEANALRAFPYGGYEVILMTVEHNFYVDGGRNKREIQGILTKNGYVLVADNVCVAGKPFEDWYVNKKYM